MVPKWQIPLKNWVYYFLHENRTHLREVLSRIYSQLSKMPVLRPIQVSINEFLAQIWLIIIRIHALKKPFISINKYRKLSTKIQNKIRYYIRNHLARI